MSSILFNGAFCITRWAKPPFWALPSTLLSDVCLLPVLFCAEVIYQTWDIAICPLANIAASILKNVPEPILAFAGKALFFAAPIATVAGLYYGGKWLFTPPSQENQSLSQNEQASLPRRFINFVCTKEALGLLVFGMLVGSALSKGPSPSIDNFL